MSKRSDLEVHLRSLQDINEILAAMKSLALMESHKLARQLSAQQRVVSSLETAANDFLAFHPALAPNPTGLEPTYLLIGSERGFCGAFNEQLLEEFERHCQETSLRNQCAIVVGRKLSGKLSGDPRLFASLDGPTASEEVQAVLLRLMDTLQAVQAGLASHNAFDLRVLYHDAEREAMLIQPFQPFGGTSPVATPLRQPALLNLDPVEFMKNLADLYLFSGLHKIFYSSLMAENHYRLLHMDGAMHRLDEELDTLQHTRNALRQEAITEEIEIIMLSAEAQRARAQNSEASP